MLRQGSVAMGMSVLESSRVEQAENKELKRLVVLEGETGIKLSGRNRCGKEN